MSTRSNKQCAFCGVDHTDPSDGSRVPCPQIEIMAMMVEMLALLRKVARDVEGIP